MGTGTRGRDRDPHAGYMNTAANPVGRASAAAAAPDKGKALISPTAVLSTTLAKSPRIGASHTPEPHKALAMARIRNDCDQSVLGYHVVVL